MEAGLSGSGVLSLVAPAASAWYRDQHVLVTGGSGVIGAELVRQLAPLAPRALVTLSRRPYMPNPSVDAHVGDLLDPNAAARAVENATLVFHLAGCKRRDSLDGFEQSNVAATSVLLDACKRSAATVVMASTAYVYSPSPQPVGEDDPTEPTTEYGRSKLAAESLVRKYAAARQGSAIIARLANVYGGPVEPDTVVGAALQQAALPVIGLRTLTPIRDFLHVRDAAAALLHVAPHASSSCPIVNVGSGVGSSVLDIARAVADAAGSQAQITGRTDDPADVLVLDVTRLQALTGWRHSISLRAGLAGALQEMSGSYAGDSR